jgi:hypothetical protein
MVANFQQVGLLPLLDEAGWRKLQVLPRALRVRATATRAKRAGGSLDETPWDSDWEAKLTGLIRQASRRRPKMTRSTLDPRTAYVSFCHEDLGGNVGRVYY